MHIPDGYLGTKTCPVTLTVAATGLAWALHQCKTRLSAEKAPLVGGVAACVFAAQMVNFPIAHGTSGHVIGGVFAALMLGPGAATLVMAAVLAVQCFLFQDGGVAALGANILNMGLIGAAGGYAIHQQLRQRLAGPAGMIISSTLAAWAAVVIASLACAVELAASGTVNFTQVLPAMVGTHAVIGLGEALATGLAVALLLQWNPALLQPAEPAPIRTATPPAINPSLLPALVIAVCLSPLACSSPDGLQFLAAQFGFAGHAHPLLSAPLADYTLPFVSSNGWTTSLAGAIGVLATFAVARCVTRLFRPLAKVN